MCEFGAPLNPGYRMNSLCAAFAADSFLLWMGKSASVDFCGADEDSSF